MKPQILVSTFLLLASAGCDSARTYQAAEVSPIVYPAPPGELSSAFYEVQVVDQGTMRNSFVYSDVARQVTTPGYHGTDQQKGRSFSWTTFEIERPTTVRVTRLGGGFKSVKLRPTRYRLRTRTINRNTIEFTILPKQKVSVEFDTATTKCVHDKADCVRDILMIFADQRDPQSPLLSYSADDIYRPAPGNYASTATISGITAPVVSTLGNADNKKVVVFGPGVYTIGYWEVPNKVEHIHIEGGAIVYGAVNVIPEGPAPAADDYLNKAFQFTLRNSFKLTGHGILSGRKIPFHMTQDFKYCPDDECWWKTTRLVRLNVTNITVADVTLANSPNWNISIANDADSRTTGLLRGFKVVAQWAFQNDGTVSPRNGRIEDCFIQSYDDSIKLTQSGSNVERCIIWQFGNGANFQIGWYPKSISNVHVADIDVIHSENWWGANDNAGLLSYTHNSPGNGLIHDLSFSNINLEDKLMRLVGLFPESGQRIDGVKFTNINVDAWGNDAFASGQFNILKASNGGSISNLTFSGLKVGGKLVTNTNYSTHGRFQLLGNTSNVVFKP